MSDQHILFHNTSSSKDVLAYYNHLLIRNISVSFDVENIIYQILNDINLYDDNELCIIMFDYINNELIPYTYQIFTVLSIPYHELYTIVSLKQALKIFQYLDNRKD